MKEKLKKNNGITLIALVITILVLLILAGVSVRMVVGNNGVINKSQNAKIVYSESEDKSAIGLEFTACRVENADTLEVSETEFKNKLENNFKENIELDAIGDGSFVVTLSDSDKIYYVYEEGNVIGGMYDSIAINSVDDFKKFRDNVNNGESYENKYVYLTTDLNLGNEEWEPIGYYDQNGLENENNKPFKGVFDGYNHKINGLKINTTNKAYGLFGFVKDGQIKRLGIESGSITCGASCGAVAGVLHNNSKTYDCYNKVNIVSNGDNVGGIVGQLSTNSIIDSCYNTGDINAGDKKSIGGISGVIKRDSIIKRSYNTGNITNGGNIIAGVLGTNSDKSIVEECYNKGNINGKQYVGGIVAYNIDEQNDIVKNCYNTGSITSTSIAGGVVSVNAGKIYNSYSIGNVTGNEYIGSVLGRNVSNGRMGEIYRSFGLEGTCSEVIGYINPDTIVENCTFVSSTDLKNYANKLGSEFKNDSENINGGYPILSWQ